MFLFITTVLAMTVVPFATVAVAVVKSADIVFTVMKEEN